jgi:hypothetical protein
MPTQGKLVSLDFGTLEGCAVLVDLAAIRARIRPDLPAMRAPGRLPVTSFWRPTGARPHSCARLNSPCWKK